MTDKKEEKQIDSKEENKEIQEKKEPNDKFYGKQNTPKINE